MKPIYFIYDQRLPHITIRIVMCEEDAIMYLMFRVDNKNLRYGRV